MSKGILLFLAVSVPLAIILFSGCQPTTGVPPGVPQVMEIDYQKWLNHTADDTSPIVVGDILLVYHEEESEINGPYWVFPGGLEFSAAAGSITPFGLGEDVVVATRLLEQAKEDLEAKYKALEQEVTLQIKNLRECILITGEVEKQGLYELSDVKSFGQVLEEAGGFTSQANKVGITVFRKSEGDTVTTKVLNYKKDKDGTLAYEVLPGDRITVLRTISYSTN